MKVRELIKQLMDTNPELEVIMQKDAEGNGYSPLSDIDPEAIYIPDSAWSGHVYSTTWSWEDADWESEKGWENFKHNNPKCLVLCPVN